MTTTDDASIKDIEDVLGPRGPAYVRYHLTKDHKARTDALEEILEYCYNELIKNRHLNLKQSEDELSVQIVGNLRMLQILATHDTQTGGHCDIHVEGKDHFLWIGEAKIHSDYGWLKSGFLQLSTRYATGSYGQDRGEIIIYCRRSNAASVLEKWKSIIESEFQEVNITEDNIVPRLWFRTYHICVNSGTPFYTRHRILNLYWPGTQKKSDGGGAVVSSDKKDTQ